MIRQADMTIDMFSRPQDEDVEVDVLVTRSRLRVPRQTAAVLALIETGITDYEILSVAVGLSIEEVRQIDMAQDPEVRRLGIHGLPSGEYFRLRNRVRCPKCSAWLTIAPCVACHVQKIQKKAARYGSCNRLAS